MLSNLITNLYDCHYDQFFLALGTFLLRLELPIMDSRVLSCPPRLNTPAIIASVTTLCLHRPGAAHQGVQPTPRQLREPFTRRVGASIRREQGLGRDVRAFVL